MACELGGQVRIPTMSETPAPYSKRAQVDGEHAEVVAETMGELLVEIGKLRTELATVREAQDRSLEVIRLHGHQLDGLTAAIERLGGMLERAAGGDRLSS